MTDRKPPGVSWQSWIDRQIEAGRAEGAFDGLPGEGRPLRGIDRPRDELWWVRDKLRREGVDHLPPALAIRRDADEAVARALAATTESEARRILEEINERIRYLNSHTIDGPPTTLMPLDVDEVLSRRPPAPPPAPEVAPPPAEPTPPSWWRRLRRLR